MRNSKILMTRQVRVLFVHFCFDVFVFIFFFGEGGDCGSVGYIFMCTFLFCYLRCFFIGRRLF